MKKINIKNILAGIILVTSIVTDWSKNIIAVPLIIFWILLAYLEDKFKFKEFFLGTKKVILSIYLWIFCSMILYLFKNQYMTSYVFKNILRISANMLIFGYYIKYEKKETIKKLLYISTITIIIISIHTITILIKYPTLSRVLSTENPELSQDYINVKYVGGYGFIYGLVFIIISLFGMLKYATPKMKIVIIVTLIILGLTLLYAQFSIAILLTILGIILNIANINNLKKTITIITILMVLILSMKYFILYALDFFSNKIEQQAIAIRILEIRNFIESGDLNNSEDFNDRVKRYKISIDTFWSDILALNAEKTIGGHSEILDEYAKYGIVVATISFLPILLYSKWVYSILHNNKAKKTWYIDIMIYLVLSTINTSMFIVTMILFTFGAPAIILNMEGEDNENSLDS